MNGEKYKSGHIMIFGKFIGCDFADMPTWYLKWIVKNIDNYKIIEHAEGELVRRGEL